MKKTLSRIGLLLGVTAAIALPQMSFAQNYPAKQVRIIVPHGAGSSPDVATRLIAQRLTERLGQSFFIDNRAGAGGSIGMGAIAKSPNDGYTLGIGHIGTLTINPSVYAKLPYDPVKDFTPIMQTVKTPLLVVVSEASPYKSIADVVAAAKANPGKLTFSSAGNGTASHMAGEYFKTLAGVSVTHIPFRSAPDALLGVASNDVTLTFGGQPSAWPLVRGKRLRALALTSDVRMKEFPEVPVVAETLKGYEVFDWNGFIAPAGTSPEIVAKLHEEITAILKQPELEKQFLDQGLIPVKNTPAQFQKFIESERQKWGRLAKQVNIQLD